MAANHKTPPDGATAGPGGQTHPAPREDGAKVDEYTLKHMVGKGTYGSVYLAEHNITKYEVALKIVDYRTGDDRQSRRQNRRLEREVKLLNLLHHPHIVRIFDVKQSSKCLVMVQEYLGTRSLLDYIQRHKALAEAEACRLFRQIVSAVDYLHRNCIVHRDLKLGNIMVDSENKVRIIDFGFANTFEWGKHLTTFCGSPCYASPEIVCGIPYTGPEVDIWSMGIVLYCMLCGRLPFTGGNNHEVFARITSGHFSIPPGVSKEAQDLLRRMLSVDPRRRITMAGIYSHPWVYKFDSAPINNHLPLRPAIVLHPNEASLRKMPAYNFDVSATVAALASSEMACTPIVSIYHLVDESARRKAVRRLRRTRQYMATSSASVYSNGYQ